MSGEGREGVRVARDRLERLRLAGERNADGFAASACIAAFDSPADCICCAAAAALFTIPESAAGWPESALNWPALAERALNTFGSALSDSLPCCLRQGPGARARCSPCWRSALRSLHCDRRLRSTRGSRKPPRSGGSRERLRMRCERLHGRRMTRDDAHQRRVGVMRVRSQRGCVERCIRHTGKGLRIAREGAERLRVDIRAAMTCGWLASAWNPGLAASARKLGSWTISSNASVCINSGTDVSPSVTSPSPTWADT